MPYPTDHTTGPQRVSRAKRRLKLAGQIVALVLTLAGGFAAGETVGDFDDDTCIEIDD